MAQYVCPSCNAVLSNDFRFCPHCGHKIQKQNVCQECNCININSAKFCQECGALLSNGLNVDPQLKVNKQSKPGEIDPPPVNGITIEFRYSSAQTFELALECAKQFPTFQQYEEGKKAIYRVTFDPSNMASVLELVEYLKGWRRRVLYVNAEKVTWDSVFSFKWCYEKRMTSFKPEIYCFGYEHESEINIWGCIYAHMPFYEYTDWFCWGKWLNTMGDWQFDKERIRHELQKELFRYRFCPAMQSDLVEDALNILPEVVNPNKDKNWKFKWGGDNSSGLLVTINRYGVKEKRFAKGVSPNGPGALKEIIKRMKYRLPDTKNINW